MGKIIVSLLVFLLTSLSLWSETPEKRFSVMGLGDSITEGGETFHSYLSDLRQMLLEEGYDADFIGPRKSITPTGEIYHCGFSGKPVEYLESLIDSIYKLYPADIILLHAGHNHFADQQPVNGMINAYKSIIHKIHDQNSKAWILIAKVTPSGKLPKYGYIPELNRQIDFLVNSMKEDRVMIVDMATGHDWRQMTISDNVHPNDLGASFMAERWFKAISQISSIRKNNTKHLYIFDETASIL